VAAVVAQAPGLADDLRLDDAVAAGWTVDGPTATDSGGLRVVVTRSFASVDEATALLGSVNGTGGPLQGITLTRSVTDSEVTTSLNGSLRVDGGLNAFADPDLLAAIGGTPYADDIAAAGLTPADAVTFTLVADLPGSLSPDAAGSVPTSLTWSVPIDGTAATVSATSVATIGGEESSVWGTVATIALIALIVWCVLAVAFIAFVASARRRKAQRRAGRTLR